MKLQWLDVFQEINRHLVHHSASIHEMWPARFPLVMLQTVILDHHDDNDSFLMYPLLISCISMQSGPFIHDFWQRWWLMIPTFFSEIKQGPKGKGFLLTRILMMQLKNISNVSLNCNTFAAAAPFLTRFKVTNMSQIVPVINPIGDALFLSLPH